MSKKFTINLKWWWIVVYTLASIGSAYLVNTKFGHWYTFVCLISAVYWIARINAKDN